MVSHKRPDYEYAAAGIAYEGPITIGDGEVLLRAFAEEDGIETKAEFRFAAKGKKGVQIDDVKPGRLVSRTGRKLDSRGKTFEGLKQATEKSATFEGIVLTVGQGNQMIGVIGPEFDSSKYILADSEIDFPIAPRH